MAEKLLFEATLKDNVSSQANKVGDSFGGLAKKAGLAALAFVSVEKAISFLGDAYAEAKEGAIATEKLTAALGKNSKALADQANKLQFRSRFEDDAITSMQAALATYVKSEDAILKLTPAIIDLAEATGVDLKSAALQVGKAIADDSDEMGKYKIKIDGAAGSNERATSVMQGLSEKFGGQAEAASNAAGQVDILGKSYKGLLQTIGDLITPAADFWAAQATEIIDFWNNALNAADPSIGKLEKKIADVKSNIAMNSDASGKPIWGLEDGVKESRHELYLLELQLKQLREELAKPAAPVKVSGKITGLTSSADPDAAKNTATTKASIAQRNAEISAANDAALLQRVQKEAQSQLEIEQVYEDGMVKILGINADMNAEKQKSIDDRIAKEKAALDKSFADEAEAADKKIALHKAVAAGATTAAGMVIQSAIDISKASGASAKEMQGLAMAQAAINGASAVVSIWSQAGQLGPIAGPIVAGIETAAIIAMTAAQMATISQQKFASGGIVQGPSRGDSVQIRANGGEMMLNREQQANLFAMAKGGAGGSGPSIMIAPTVKVDSGMSASEKRRIINATANTTRDALKQLSRTNRLPAGMVFA